MQWLKAFHLIFVVTWFSGLFYLPRLYVYHAESNDAISNARFKIMERKLFFGITTPSAVLALLFGILIFSYHWQIFLQAPWFHAKLFLVILLCAYHIYLGKLYFAFKQDRNAHGSLFYRILNEVPVVLLILIVLLVKIKPWQ